MDILNAHHMVVFIEEQLKGMARNLESQGSYRHIFCSAGNRKIQKQNEEIRARVKGHSTTKTVSEAHHA